MGGLKGIPIRAGFGQSWGRLCRLVRQTQPQTYIGFPTALLGLARVYGADFPIQRALVSADACPAGVMLALDEILESKLYPHYGSRECGLGGAITCPAFQGMHLRENHIIGEIVDADGIAVPEGGYGELVITTIGLEAMPLIRYRTGDYTRFLPPAPAEALPGALTPSPGNPAPFPWKHWTAPCFPCQGSSTTGPDWITVCFWMSGYRNRVLKKSSGQRQLPAVPASPFGFKPPFFLMGIHLCIQESAGFCTNK